jgi:transposase
VSEVARRRSALTRCRRARRGGDAAAKARLPSCNKTGADEVAEIIRAPAPARLIEGGLPTKRLVADVVVSNFADHLPLYLQSQILARSGVKIERSSSRARSARWPPS